jgi:hypothetical protein
LQLRWSHHDVMHLRSVKIDQHRSNRTGKKCAKGGTSTNVCESYSGTTILTCIDPVDRTVSQQAHCHASPPHPKNSSQLVTRWCTNLTQNTSSPATWKSIPLIDLHTIHPPRWATAYLSPDVPSPSIRSIHSYEFMTRPEIPQPRMLQLQGVKPFSVSLPLAKGNRRKLKQPYLIPAPERTPLRAFSVHLPLAKGNRMRLHQYFLISARLRKFSPATNLACYCCCCCFFPSSASSSFFSSFFFSSSSFFFLIPCYLIQLRHESKRRKVKKSKTR